MRRSTLLIGRYIFDQYPFLFKLKGSDFRDLLRHLLKDPELWKKIRILESEKYTKTYQEDGLDLIAVKFYPFPEDWCELSVLSNGTGFSRCFIFVYLLEYYLGLKKLNTGVTNHKIVKKCKKSKAMCTVKVSRIDHILERRLKYIKKPILLNQIPLLF